MPKTIVRYPKRVSTRVSDITYDVLAIKAKKMGLTVAELVRIIIERDLKGEQ